MGRELREVWYSGHVQGVGFRYTVLGLARRSDVTGYVRNLPDGRVHLVVEGDVHELDAFLEALAERMQGYIRETLTDRRPATGAVSRVRDPIVRATSRLSRSPVGGVGDRRLTYLLCPPNIPTRPRVRPGRQLANQRIGEVDGE